MGEYRIGDALTVLRELGAGRFHCCVTSPPYWGLRDYGVEGQLGVEKTVEEYVERVVEIFREVRRVLRPDGTLWVNLGDCYNTSLPGNGHPDHSGPRFTGTRDGQNRSKAAAQMVRRDFGTLKRKDLVGVPWRVAFALQADGWWLRSDIIWSKPTLMPEAVTDRPTKSHDYIFLLARSEQYHYDAAAIREPVSGGAHARGSGVNPKARAAGSSKSRQNASFSAAVTDLVDRRNKRSVWTIQSSPYSGAHFATYPPDLIKPCILAGCPLGGEVLDPFFGSGTTGQVCEVLGRRWFGIELNPEYESLIRKRTAQQGLGL